MIVIVKPILTVIPCFGLFGRFCVGDFEFVLGLVVLKVILSNTSSLSSYLQGKRVDVMTAWKTADATIETLNSCRNEECFNLTWKRAKALSNEIKQSIKGSEFLFKEAKVPRNRQPS